MAWLAHGLFEILGLPVGHCQSIAGGREVRRKLTGARILADRLEGKALRGQNFAEAVVVERQIGLVRHELFI